MEDVVPLPPAIVRSGPEKAALEFVRGYVSGGFFASFSSFFFSGAHAALSGSPGAFRGVSSGNSENPGEAIFLLRDFFVLFLSIVDLAVCDAFFSLSTHANCSNKTRECRFLLSMD